MFIATTDPLDTRAPEERNVPIGEAAAETLRSAGARIEGESPIYKHLAPLGQKPDQHFWQLQGQFLR
jgi:hypothetical protein